MPSSVLVAAVQAASTLIEAAGGREEAKALIDALPRE
jgi:hypothetical protein